MLARRSVLDEGPSMASTAAHPKIGVELLVRARSELGELGQGVVAEHRREERLDQQGVARAGGLADASEVGGCALPGCSYEGAQPPDLDN